MKQNNLIEIFTLVMILTIIGMGTSQAQNEKNTYKDELIGKALMSRTIYKKNDDGSDLSLHMKKEYAYDEQNRIKTFCISHWNKEKRCWDKALFYTYKYDGELYSIELLKYNTGENKFIKEKLRCVYSVDDDLNLLFRKNYEWDKKRKDWVLKHHSF